MIIREGETILYRSLPGKYEIATQEQFEAIKNVYDDQGNIIHVKEDLSIQWELADINWFAGQHIEKYYPLWKQSNITREGGDALTRMNTFINAVRAWSNTTPLPNPWSGSLEVIIPEE